MKIDLSKLIIATIVTCGILKWQGTFDKKPLSLSGSTLQPDCSYIYGPNADLESGYETRCESDDAKKWPGLKEWAKAQPGVEY